MAAVVAHSWRIVDHCKTYIALNWIPWRNVLNLNTFDNLRVIHLSKLEMCFQVSNSDQVTCREYVWQCVRKSFYDPQACLTATPPPHGCYHLETAEGPTSPSRNYEILPPTKYSISEKAVTSRMPFLRYALPHLKAHARPSAMWDCLYCCSDIVLKVQTLGCVIYMQLVHIHLQFDFTNSRLICFRRYC